MNNLERLKLFLTDFIIPEEELISILRERKLDPYEEYDKYTHKRLMLSCVYATYSYIKAEIQNKQDRILDDILRQLEIKA